MDGVTDLRKAVECPVCYDVGKRIFICLNGHSICDACKAKVGNCPQGACRFADPPTRNRALEELIPLLNIQFTCNTSKECNFKGTRAQLELHESECEQRSVPCPGQCKASLPLVRLMAHLKENHSPAVTVSHVMVEDCVFRKAFVWKPEKLVHFAYWFWYARCDLSPHGWVFFKCWLKDGVMHLAVVMAAGRNTASRFKCEMSLSHEGNEMTLMSPVYPVDATEEDTLNDDDCIRIDRRIIRKFLTDEGLTPEWREQGYSAVFWVNFKLIEETSAEGPA